MNRAQRIVLVIALALALVVIAIAANLVMSDPLEAGWFRVSESVGVTLAPSQTDDYFVVASDRSVMEQAAVWLVGIGMWTGASLWLLRSARAEGP
jgi:hypothetical protein